MSHKRKNLIEACTVVGGQTALGDLIGKDQGFIWHLLNRAESIKAEIAINIAKVSGVPLDLIVEDFSPDQPTREDLSTGADA